MKCECCDTEIPDDNDAWRITMRGEGLELRGHFVGDIASLKKFAAEMKPYGLVIASPLGAET